MGKIKDMFQAQIKSYGRYEKRKRWEKTIPKIVNFDLTTKQVVEDIGLLRADLVVTDLLAIDEKAVFTKMVKIDYNDGLILSIKCPLCGQELFLNRHWYAYFCDCGNHNKKVFEILRIEHRKPLKIVELKDDDY